MRQLLFPALLAALLAASACATPSADTLKKVQETGTLAIGYRESSVPFSFVDPDKKPAGYSVDLCKRIAAAVQQQLGLANLQAMYLLNGLPE